MILCQIPSFPAYATTGPCPMNGFESASLSSSRASTSTKSRCCCWLLSLLLSSERKQTGVLRKQQDRLPVGDDAGEALPDAEPVLD